MILVWLIAQLGFLAIDCCLLFFLLDQLIFMLFIHILISFLNPIAFGGALSSLYPQGEGNLLGWILVLFLPVVGIGCTFLISLFLLYKPLPAGDLLEEFEEHVTLPDVVSPKQKLIDEEMNLLHLCRNAEPLVDMLRGPDLEMKRAILDAIAKRKNPKLIPHILAALKDNRPEIYQLAFAKVTQLQNEYGLKIIRATEAVRKSPENPEVLNLLSKGYEEYLNSGLVDGSVVGFFQDKLKKVYKKILSLSPEEPQILKNLGQMFLEHKQWKEAEGAFKKALVINPKDLEAHLGLIKVFYSQSVYSEMIEQLHQVKEKTLALGTEANPNLREFIQWWLTADVGTSKAVI